jgi:hypothetical protein
MLLKKHSTTFRTSVAAPSLSDLRELLKGAFDPAQVELFFRALDESGIGTFDAFEKASQESIISILGRLNELGFKFSENAGNVEQINTALQEAEKSANAGLDPLAKAIELVTRFNSGAQTLPPVFDSTAVSVDKTTASVQALSSEFDGVLRHHQCSLGETFSTDVVFNVKTVGVQIASHNRSLTCYSGMEQMRLQMLELVLAGLYLMKSEFRTEQRIQRERSLVANSSAARGKGEYR